MGIFGFKTKYDITPKTEELKTLVINYNDVDVVKMNAKLVVPEGYFFVIGKRGKALDLFDTGEYFLNTSALPYMCRKFNIDKVKGGKSQDKIPADFYFLNKNLWGGMFKTHRKANMGTKAYGMYSVKVKGVFSYKIIEPREFMQSLLNEFDYIRTGEAEDIVNSWVSDEVLSELEKKNFIINDIVSNSSIVVDCLKNRISKLFSIAGLELVDFKIVKYELPKEYQEASDTVLKMQELGQTTTQSPQTEQNPENFEEVKEIKNDIDFKEENDLDQIMDDIQAAKDLLKEFNIGGEFTEFLSEETAIASQENSNSTPLQTEETKESQPEFTAEEKIFALQEDTLANKNLKIENSTQAYGEKEEAKNQYVPFGNFVIEDAPKSERPTQAVQNEASMPAKPKRNFVDLTLTDIYSQNIETKRCVTCGSENHISASHCIICGDKFISE